MTLILQLDKKIYLNNTSRPLLFCFFTTPCQFFYFALIYYLYIFMCYISIINRQVGLHTRRWRCHSKFCQQTKERGRGKPSLAGDAEAMCDKSQLAVDEIPLSSATGKETVRSWWWANNREWNQGTRGREQGIKLYLFIFYA